ncbi:MAG: D-lyxose/D-mannose family sugar isomerase, partial [Fimbriimonadaceae bacterium]
FQLKVNGEWRTFQPGEQIVLEAGHRITLTQGVYHRFWPESDECIIGEVSTANDDEHDNFFADPEVGRFPGVEEDEPPLVRLVSDR